MKTISRLFFNRIPAVKGDELPEQEIPRTEIVSIPLDQIMPNPFQPRKTFSAEGLQELCASIREFGVIQPLIVRKTGSGYELIAGERRLRASGLAGRDDVPCVLRDASDKEMAEIALIENLQREDLHFFEEAQGYEKLLRQFNLTQEVLAERVGKTQSSIANKLRLLKLPPELREYIFDEKLTERHARALLKVEDAERQWQILKFVAENKLNVREAESLIEAQVQNEPVPEQKVVRRPQMLKIVKDVRIFINTVGELVKQMKKTGLEVRLTQEQDDEFVTITMVVPKRR
jgi:ParB family chromosome partitioning protein